MYVERNIEARSCNHSCIGKAKSITYSEFMLIALGIQHAMRMRRILLLPVACTLSHKRHDVRKISLNIKCVF